jgi:3',5'-cyclic AMP phosphodiesterase CpdA
MHMFSRASVLLAALVCCAGQAVASDFRVLPYQQNLTQNAVTLNWFTIAQSGGTVTLTGPGLANPLVLSSTPELQTVLDYQYATELAASNFIATSVRDGVAPARNYKHSVRIEGLTPGTEYTYVVTQGGTTYSNLIRTAPLASDTAPIRFSVISDSETLVLGRTRFREWSRSTPRDPAGDSRPSGTGRGRDTYFLTETVGYVENIKQIKARDPRFVVMPGDLIEGTANEQQRRWDEFWRHNAGEYDDLLSGRPVIAAIGNNCIFAGTTTSPQDTTNHRISFSRQQWSAYWDAPSNGNPNYQDLYFRTDYGPITVLTLCVVKAVEAANHLVAPPVGTASSETVAARLNRDTNRAWANQPYTFGDLPDFNIGTEQWDWTREQLAQARAAGQIIFVQWHHTPFSRGVHGSSVTSDQSGEATRIYAPLLEEFRVAGLFCGHSEVAEMSYFDLNGDGYGVHLWDVGFAGDGLRGVEDAEGFVNARIATWRQTEPEFQMNPHHVWAADQSEPELWRGRQLLSGGKHYGFLEVNVTPLADSRYRIEFENWHNFPLNNGDENFTVTGYELRKYDNRVVLEGTADDLRPINCRAADYNRDGGVEGADIEAFFADWSAGAARSDVNRDGGVDGTDVRVFFEAWASGSC